MKIMQWRLPILLLFTSLFGSAGITSAQKKSAAKDSLVRALVENQQYVFLAQNVTPMSGRQRFLTTDYTVIISKDTIISDLPYFGRAYSASFNGDGGIKFISTDFDYYRSPRKKGGWDIKIKAKDTPNAQQFNLTVFENGSASLQASSSDRQPISFNGYIRDRKKRK